MTTESKNLQSMEPKLVWKHFQNICNIPHGSGNEQKLSQYVINYAQKHNCKITTDKASNILLSIPPTQAKKIAGSVAIQAHLDMVCEKNEGTQFDFEKDPIQTVIKDQWVCAKGTSLGADNGIGLAMALALIEDKSFEHGPLEILCTMDEERGLNGANALQKDWLESDILINTDTEDEGIFIMGCAGGFDTDFKLPIQRTQSSGLRLKIAVQGLSGGHSGLDINKNKANAIKILCQALTSLREQFDFNLCDIKGGDKRNAIPREATAIICLEKHFLEKFTIELSEYQKKYSKILPETFKITWKKELSSLEPLSLACTKKALNLLLALPHGVMSMSPVIDKLVESSSNLAKVHLNEDLEIFTSSRFTEKISEKNLKLQLNAIGSLAGSQINFHTKYPSWNPDFNSPLIEPIKKLYKKMFNKDAIFTCIHAGLECGVIKSKYDNMHLISMGPDIRNPHSPDERVNICSVARTYNFLCSLLCKLAS